MSKNRAKEGRQCVGCLQFRSRDAYSRSQWEKPVGGRCVGCIEGSTPSPAAPAASAPPAYSSSSTSPAAPAAAAASSTSSKAATQNNQQRLQQEREALFRYQQHRTAEDEEDHYLGQGPCRFKVDYGESESAFQCAVCLDPKLKVMALTPCMHTVCEGCVNKLNYKCCHCREKALPVKDPVMSAAVQLLVRMGKTYQCALCSSLLEKAELSGHEKGGLCPKLTITTTGKKS